MTPETKAFNIKKVDKYFENKLTHINLSKHFITMVYRTELCGELSNELTITRSVSKIIFKPAEIGNYNSFLVSVTTDVVIELYQYIKKM